MRYKTLLTLFLIYFTASVAVGAESSRYRVEVLVLTHIDHQQEAREVRHLKDYSSALDFLQPPEEPAEDPSEEAPAATLDGEPAIPADAWEEIPQIEEDPWNVVTHVEEMGPELQEAWRRLRLSGPFRPLQYLAWEQGSNPPFPLLRVHDLVTVLVEDPWIEQRTLLLEEGDGSTVFGDSMAAPSVTAPAGTADADAADTDIGDTEVLPDPIAYYQLDGTVSLTRSRFLHIAVDIEWREPLFDEPRPTIVMPVPAGGEPRTTTEPIPAAFRVHALEQSRPVRSGRMEYFDGPVLGVLVWLSDISDTIVEQETE
jgi:hypothetical protein